jgi:prepilin-type N-terminal cleavage/methylation domain-containing protein
MMRAAPVRRSSGESGFTLLEIMIVISIVSVVAAIAVPRFMDAQKQAQRTRAIAILRQIWDAQQNFHRKNGVYAVNLPQLVSAGLLAEPFSATNFGLQKNGYYEYYTCVPTYTSSATPISLAANPTMRFRVGCQPVGTDTNNRLRAGDQMFFMLETGRIYVHKPPACSLQHVDSSCSSGSDSLFGSAYPELGDQ